MSNAVSRQTDDPADRRVAERVALKGDSNATAVIGSDAHDCRLIDLSATGAKLKFHETPSGFDQIEISHAQLGDLIGEFVWQSGSYVGIRFRTADIEKFLAAARS